jgi:hypothetical protein
MTWTSDKVPWSRAVNAAAALAASLAWVEKSVPQMIFISNMKSLPVTLCF